MNPFRSRTAESSGRQAIIDIHKQLYSLGYGVANDGNSSIRLNETDILVSPAGVNKHHLKPDQIIHINLDGQKLTPSVLAPTSELAMHLHTYRARPDIGAIVHAHPPYTIACSLAGVSLNDPILPELLASLGGVETADYMTPGTQELGQQVARSLSNKNAVILKRHGSVAIGCTLQAALDRVEQIEHSAQIIWLARILGPVSPLTTEESQLLLSYYHKPVTH